MVERREVKYGVLVVVLSELSGEHRWEKRTTAAPLVWVQPRSPPSGFLQCVLDNRLTVLHWSSPSSDRDDHLLALNIPILRHDLPYPAYSTKGE